MLHSLSENEGATFAMTKIESSAIFLVLLVTSSLVACSSLPPYEGPSAENKASAASIDNSGGRFSCGPFSEYPRICNATVNVIDGKKTAVFWLSMQVDPRP